MQMRRGGTFLLAGALLALVGGPARGETVEEFVRYIPELPEDTAAWVLGELQN